MRHPVIHLLRRSLILLAILMVADRLIGAALEQGFYRQQHGDDIVTLYILDSTREDLIVFGSSRASHHYKTRLAEQKLGFPVYNGGRDNMAITYTASVLPYVFKRHSPKYIIVDILPAELNGYGRDITDQRISTALLPYANRHPDLWPTVALTGQMEVMKAAVSKIYPYNSLLGTIVQNTYTSFGHSSDRGYEPLSGSIDSAHYTIPVYNNYDKQHGIDTALVGRLRQIIILAKQHNTTPIIVLSPFYFHQDAETNDSYRMLHQLSKDWDFMLYDFTYDTRFLRHPDLFYDELHLNDSGATVFTNIITDTLRNAGLPLSVVSE